MDQIAEALADELRAMAGHRQRLLAAECDAGLVEVAPWLRWDPARRSRLAEALGELERAGEVAWSVGRDASARPTLPRFVTLTGRGKAVAEPAGVGHPWRPELEWAHDLRLDDGEFAVLLVIQEFLRDRPDAPALAHRERSLELFGHEKRLDRLVRARLFEPGRLSLELLRCWWTVPPIAWKRLEGRGPVVVSENAAGYHAIGVAYASGASAVAYGAGGAFAQSVAALTEVGEIGEIRYIGDLDAEGVAIPQRAAMAAARVGLPAPLPDLAQWQRLVVAAERFGQEVERVPGEVAAELCAWFGEAPVGKAVEELLENGVRVPQEVLTAEVLSEVVAAWPSHLPA